MSVIRNKEERKTRAREDCLNEQANRALVRATYETKINKLEVCYNICLSTDTHGFIKDL